MSRIHIRDRGVSPDDAAFIVEAFNSTLPHLAEIGSGEMWGSQPFSQRDGFAEETVKDVKTSEKYRLTDEADEALRIFIAEVDIGSEGGENATRHDDAKGPGLRYRIADDGTKYLSVGAASVKENGVPAHIEDMFELESITSGEPVGRGDYVFLDVVITYYRTGGHQEGAGEALIRRAKEYGIEKGKRWLYVDAWTGNEDKLVRFYEEHGFNVVGIFAITWANGTTWSGALMGLPLGAGEQVKEG